MLFENNKYSKWYISIINNAKNRTTVLAYSEKHHIVPKSIGGLNNKENLVTLTAKEHFVCHLLLTKMLTGTAKQKMIYAFWQLSNQTNTHQHRHKSSSRMYELARKMFSEQHSTNMKQNHPFLKEENRKKHQLGVDKRGPTAVKGIKRSEETKEKLRNKTWTEKAIQSRLSNCLKNARDRKGSNWSKSHRQSRLTVYLEKNIDIATKVFELHDAGLNNLQISKELQITWDKVKYSLIHRQDFETYNTEKVSMA
jgi:hypothetical protein